jgi:hypothetical protein
MLTGKRLKKKRVAFSDGIVDDGQSDEIRRHPHPSRDLRGYGC